MDLYYKIAVSQDGVNNSNTKSVERLSLISLVFIITFGLLIRLYVTFLSGLPWLSTDTYAYMDMATAILAGHPIACYPNGLPLLMAITKILFNPEKIYINLVILNVLFSTLIVYMVALITTKITKNKLLGIVAAIIICLYPNQINYTRLILSEIPTCFLLTFSIFIFLRKKYFLAGFVLYLSVMFRSDLFLVFPLLFLISLFFLYKENKTNKAFYFLGGYGLGILLYSMLLSYGIVASTNRVGLEVLKSINANSLKEEYPSTSNFSENEKQHPISTYTKFILNQPKTYIKQRLFAIENMWGWPPSPARSMGSKLLIAIRFPLFILGIIGFWKFRKNFDAWAVLMPIVALTIVHVATYSSPRYTVSVEPLLICLASLSFFKRSALQ